MARSIASGTGGPVEDLHQRVDAAVTRLAVLHRDRLKCRPGCIECCVDELSVFEVEAERIRRAHTELLTRGKPHPPGACAFLDADGACRIYRDRPYVCRTQGLPLRWIDDGPDGESAEWRDICPLNEAGPPITGLDATACWHIGPIEGELLSLQLTHGAGAPKRVKLRELFAHGTCGASRGGGQFCPPMSIKRVKQVNRGPRGRDEGISFLTPKAPERTWVWTDDVAVQPDESFVSYAPTTTFAKGTFVVHTKFGKGVVTNAEGPNIDVLFEAGPKKLRHAAAPSGGLVGSPPPR